ncbi:hypothetical protein PGH07_05865 [Sulfurovum sp. zt1-1]|uniref:Uncharacterized protein n=1 Tax=Sulfurovum zhangzhouensis TaxID=3019067 RepID=A0ABT7QXY0_9BACT|nr:hypothetical protein [Sulfurovum zhangzhouensis]MDM5271694.1 hypothetical protein [Sulfurovum zhangzhouensis]
MSYEPNVIPLKKRAFNIVGSIGLLIYGGYGIYINDLYIPGKRSSGIHLHDNPALIMYVAFICSCLVMLSVVVDHYDKRNNEYKYKLFARTLEYLGWGLFATALLLQISV